MATTDNANKTQIGGDHYKSADGVGEEHWDRVNRLGLDYFQACITKYVERCWKKNGIQDLLKAQHFIQKYIEISVVSGRSGEAELRKDAALAVLMRDTLGSGAGDLKYVRTEDMIKELSSRGPEADVLRNWTEGELLSEINRRANEREKAAMSIHDERVLGDALPPYWESTGRSSAVGTPEAPLIDDENGDDRFELSASAVDDLNSQVAAMHERGPICKECGFYPSLTGHASRCKAASGERPTAGEVTDLPGT